VLDVSRRLGHACLLITLDIYAHMFAQRHEEGAEAFEARIAKATQNER
jgi:hypothetical protein